MALFKNLKQIRDAMSPEAIKQGLAASREAMAAGATAPAGPTEEQLAALTPEQRAEYDKAAGKMAAARAEAAAVRRTEYDRQVAKRALYGPAGDYVYGELRTPEQIESFTIEDSMAVTKEQFKDVLRNPFRAPRPKSPAPAPGAPAGPVDRDSQAAAERAARDAAREPYLAPERQPLAFSRLATRNKTQVQELAAYLGSSGLSARPDLVYGVYRVPDHIGGGLRDGTRVVEWDVLHAADGDVGQSAAAAAPFFEADAQWVARRPNEPAVVDEELALDYLVRAGIGPEQCLGIARALQIKGHGGGENSSSYVISRVAGVHVFHPDNQGAGVFDALSRGELLGAEPVPGVHVEVLNWGAIRRAVQPSAGRRFEVPSPFAYLPSTGQELLRSYLEVVGVRPADSYSAQVTEDKPRDITAVSQKGPITIQTNRGEEELCADGEMRSRLRGASRVVAVYRDRPEYAEGRARWAAYEREQLQAALSHGTNLREPVERPSVLERGAIGKLMRGAEFIDSFVEGYDNNDPFDKIPPYRYCWPLAK